jgi:hypothetical protein
MPQRPVSLEPGRDGNPGRAEENWLAWCESVENQLDSDDDDPDEDVPPWDADLDALIAECREITAEEAAFAARAAARDCPAGRRSRRDGAARVSPGQRSGGRVSS